MNKSSQISVVPVVSRSQMNAFVNFTLKLYKNCEYYVPELTFDTKDTLNPKKNPALKFCQAQPFIAMQDGKVVGRVVALINPRANEAWNVHEVRFGWIDFIEDYEVCKALLDKVVEWGRERGMTELAGPMGFTDFDREGAMIMGFDRMATMATIYNYPYYIDFYERYGLGKAVDWLEFEIRLPDKLQDKYVRMVDIVKKRYNVRVRKAKNIKELKRIALEEVFPMFNEAYAKLYGFSQLSLDQIISYVNSYITFADKEMIPLVYDENDNLVGAGIMIPSIARAIQKCGGKLFPFGWWHLLKSLYFKHDDTIELLLVAVKPGWQNKGLNALIIADAMEVVLRKGFKRCETNCELEDNVGVQSLWNNFDRENHKKRRAYVKKI